MLQFGESTVRLAEVARQSGHAAEAVAELRPLAIRLEARIADGHNERDVLRLLARTHTGLGVALGLGNVLPEERLPTAGPLDPFALHEIQLRGLIATGRANAAIRLAANGGFSTGSGNNGNNRY